jgi:hypothetical protein
VSLIPVEAGGVLYEVDPQPVRTSLTDTVHTLWGFEMNVLQGGERVGVKTCFVGRVSVQGRHPEALEGTFDDLVPVLYDLAMVKVRARLDEGEPGDEILFA